MKKIALVILIILLHNLFEASGQISGEIFGRVSIQIQKKQPIQKQIQWDLEFTCEGETKEIKSNLDGSYRFTPPALTDTCSLTVKYKDKWLDPYSEIYLAFRPVRYDFLIKETSTGFELHRQ